MKKEYQQPICEKLVDFRGQDTMQVFIPGGVGSNSGDHGFGG